MRLPKLAAAAVIAVAATGCGDGGSGDGPAVLVGAGDIASCVTDGDMLTAELVEGIEGTVFTTGDNVYLEGTQRDYDDCYDPTWGRFKHRTRPVPGNHDLSSGGDPYYEYFGVDEHYSYELGGWHVIALSTLAPPDEVRAWLADDLADNDARCTLAYWHHPLFTSGAKAPGNPRVRPLWELLYEHGAEVVLNGDDHVYERFAPQSPTGMRDPRQGIRQFTVGTGGYELYEFTTKLENSEARIQGFHGVLKLTLEEGRYSWEFLPADGGDGPADSGSAACH